MTQSDRSYSVEDMTNHEHRSPHDAAPGERPEDIFEDALTTITDWMWERWTTGTAEEFQRHLEEVKQRWRERFHAARRREGVIYEGDDSDE